MSAAQSSQSITLLLEDAVTGGESRMPELMPLIYDELRQMARRQLSREQERYSLCTTGLVHEAYLKLVDDARVSSRGRAYFFAAVAHTMRRIVVDHARSRQQLKRGGDVHFTALDDKELPVEAMLLQVIDLDTALSKHEALSLRHVQAAKNAALHNLHLARTQRFELGQRFRHQPDGRNRAIAGSTTCVDR